MSSPSSSRPERDGHEAERYLSKIEDGSILACGKLRQLAGIMLPRLRAGRYKHWHYDEKRALRPVEFIERFCCLPHGTVGAPFILTDYELNAIELAFGFVDDEGDREFSEVMFMMGRKGGKTALVAALTLYMLMGDKEYAPQCYSIANSKDQASQTYGSILNMVKQSPLLSKRLHKGIIPDRSQDGLMFDANRGFFTPLSSQTRNLDGLNTHWAVLDEMSAMVNRDLYDLVKQSFGSRDQPMLFSITTNGFERGGLFDDQYDYSTRWLAGEITDDMYLPIIYELDERDEWYDEDMWVKANPGLGTVKKLTYLQGQVTKAKNDPSYLPTVLTKEFNIPENKASAWLTFEEAVNPETFDIGSMGFRYCICGYDASDSIDLTAAKAMMMRPGDDHIYELSMYWLPEEALAMHRESGRRVERDHAPYDKWVARDLVRLVPGNKIDHRVIFDWIHELADEYGIYTLALGYDPWHLTDDTWVQTARMTVGERNAEIVRFGAKTLSAPMKEIRADFKAHRIVDNHNPVNEWCRMNVSVQVDRNDN